MRQKGQLVFQFLVGAVLLFIIVVYTLGLLSGAAATARSDADANELESKALQIANKLVRTPGEWTGFIIKTPKELGFGALWPYFDGTSMLSLMNYCNTNQAELDKLLEIDRQGYIITLDAINLTTGERVPLFSSPNDRCSSTVASTPPAEIPVVQTTRIGVIAGTDTLVELMITLWNL